ncbi:lipopolysaccharide biosynthesis protein [Bacteroides cellulosilyticus]|uniref:lipopolysaccharide biosynthesis protein n=1 Tax=Bacteroides cellulosilyticus TaxID=246787 RepID=UPI001D06B97B|nr:oligosaccharide flippase family protein [Bacteroides cellulosilyticus]MCB6595104.1 hypothetical protein [Bacteroides cellulosilyticus]
MSLIKLNYSKRTNKALFNIASSFVIKGASILLSLLLVPITLDYLNPYEYGIWLTLSSVLMWINYFDIGLGNGLRNKLSEALAVGDDNLARIYVSTSFFILFLIALSIFFIFLLSKDWIDWGAFLNIPHKLGEVVSHMMTFVVLCVTIAFSLKIVTYVYFAKQMPLINNLINLLSQLFSFIFIYVLTAYCDTNKLQWVAYIYSLSPIVTLLLFYPITFLIYKELMPSLKYVKFQYIRVLMNLGIKFFLIQLSCLLIYTTSNLIISKNISPEEVTPYNIAFRYFNIVFMFFSIIIAPMWNAVSDAYNRKEFNWIQKTMKYLQNLYFFVCIGVFIMVLMSQLVYKLWIGSSVVIPFSLTIMFAVYILILTYSSLYSNFLNGMNKLNLQLYVIIVMGILFVPMATILSQCMGIIGVALSLCIANLPCAVVNYVQYRKVINIKATGLWNK